MSVTVDTESKIGSQHSLSTENIFEELSSPTKSQRRRKKERNESSFYNSLMKRQPQVYAKPCTSGEVPLPVSFEEPHDFEARLITFSPPKINTPQKMRRFLSHLIDVDGEPCFRYMPKTKVVKLPKAIHNSVEGITLYLNRPAIQDRYGREHNEKRAEVIQSYNQVFGDTFNAHNNENIYRGNAVAALTATLQMEARRYARNGLGEYAAHINSAAGHIRFVHDLVDEVRRISTLTVDEYNYIKARVTDTIITQLVDLTWRLEEVKRRETIGLRVHDGSSPEVTPLRVVSHDKWYQELFAKKEFSLETLMHKIGEHFEKKKIEELNEGI